MQPATARAVLTLGMASLIIGSSPAESGLLARFEAYRDAGVDTARSAEVHNLQIADEEVRIRLDEGTLYPLKAVDGVEHGAVFLGAGRLTYVPPGKAELGTLVRTVESRSLTVAQSGLDVQMDEEGNIDVRVTDYASERYLDLPFGYAVMRFSPDVVESLGISFSDQPGADARRAAELYEKRHRLHRRTVDRGYDGFDIDLHAMSAGLPGGDPPSFLLFETRPARFTVKHFGMERTDPWISYWHSDDEGEEHQLYVLERRTEARENLAGETGSGDGPLQEAEEGALGPTARDGDFDRSGLASNVLTHQSPRPARSPGLVRTEIASFHERAERQRYPEILLSSERHRRVDVEDVDLDLTIGKGGRHVEAEAFVRFLTDARETSWAAVELASAQPHPSNAATFGRVQVEEVTDGGGNPLDYVHTGGTLLVDLGRTLVRGQRGAFRVRYSGDLVWPDENITQTELFVEGQSGEVVPFRNRGLDFLPRALESYSPLAGFAFYPRGRDGDRARLDWTVCVPRHTRAVVSGATLREWKDPERKVRCTHSVEPTPVRDAAILFGKYDCDERQPRGLPRIWVCALPRQGRSVRGYLNETEGLLRVYQILFGDFPFEEVDIVQTGFDSGFNGSAAGVVYLDGASFLSKATLANDLSPDAQPEVNQAFDVSEIRRSVQVDLNMRHERLARLMAHQWWGEKVGPRSEHDVWLIDAVTAYGTAMFLDKLKGDDSFSLMHKEWSQNAVRFDGAAPLWQGPGPYPQGQSMASKGPAVLHMLRDEMGTEAFFDSLRTLADLAGGRDASTAELQNVCEKLHGSSLQWFFDAWVRDVVIPEVDYTWETERSKKGWDVRGTVSVSGFDHAVKVPVVIDYGRKKKADRFHVVVQPDGSPFEVTGLPVPPKRVRVDDDVLLTRKVEGRRR